MLARAGRRLAGLLFSGSCFLCRGAASELLCAACDADLLRIPAGPGAEFCPRCALASPAGSVCGRCLARPPAFDATVAALEYRFPADVLVQALKFRSELSLAALFGKLMTEARKEQVDLVIPVPLFPRRLRERGFNQAIEIARHVVRVTGGRLDPHLCERVVDTRAQLDLPVEERERNVRGAFRCNGFVGARVAVVDDVMTTGSTLNELARTLKQAGAERVVNWVLARTPAPA
jgi:ComF family protein